MTDKPSILGTDGQAHPSTTPPEQQRTMTSTEFCAGVISAYVDQMAQNGLDPVNALLEMGAQVPSAMIQFIRFHSNGLTGQAEKPLKILLQEIAKISQKFGFTMMFQLTYTGEPKGEEDERTQPNGSTPNPGDTGVTCGDKRDTSGEVQGCCDEEDEGCVESAGSDSPISKQ